MRRQCSRPAWINVCLCLALLGGRALAEDPPVTAETPATEPVAEPEPIIYGDEGDAAIAYDGMPCCCNLCPCSYVWAEALAMTRDNGADDQPLVIDLNTTDVLLTTGDLDFDWAPGLRAGYCFRYSDCWTWEFGYTGIFEESDSAVVRLDDSLMLPDDFGLQANNFFAADDVSVRYESDLHSFEANCVHCACAQGCCGGTSVELLGGFRFWDFDELFSMSSYDSSEGTSKYRVKAENHLYGGQIGSRIRCCYGRWSVEGTSKAGMYGNQMEQQQSPITDFPSVLYRTRRNGDDFDLAFVGDLNLTAIYQMTAVWGLRAGYNCIWIDNVALAANQLDFTNVGSSGRSLDGNSNVFLHGLNVGLEARW